MDPRDDASCRSIMSAPPAVLKATDSVRSALETMVALRMPSIPVTDGEGHYAGMMPRSRLIALAMPGMLSHQDETHPIGLVRQAGFFPDTLADLQVRIDAVASEPLSRHLDNQVPVLSPDTPLMNAMLFLYRQRNILPVVDNRMLVGVVSVWDVLARIGRIK